MILDSLVSEGYLKLNQYPSLCPDSALTLFKTASFSDLGPLFSIVLAAIANELGLGYSHFDGFVDSTIPTVAISGTSDGKNACAAIPTWNLFSVAYIEQITHFSGLTGPVILPKGTVLLVCGKSLEFITGGLIFANKMVPDGPIVLASYNLKPGYVISDLQVGRSSFQNKIVDRISAVNLADNTTYYYPNSHNTSGYYSASPQSDIYYNHQHFSYLDQIVLGLTTSGEVSEEKNLGYLQIQYEAGLLRYSKLPAILSALDNLLFNYFLSHTNIPKVDRFLSQLTSSQGRSVSADDVLLITHFLPRAYLLTRSRDGLLIDVEDKERLFKQFSARKQQLQQSVDSFICSVKPIGINTIKIYSGLAQENVAAKVPSTLRKIVKQTKAAPASRLSLLERIKLKEQSQLEKQAVKTDDSDLLVKVFEILYNLGTNSMSTRQLCRKVVDSYGRTIGEEQVNQALQQLNERLPNDTFEIVEVAQKKLKVVTFNFFNKRKEVLELLGSK